jgi:hypothetical protein
MPNDLRVFAAQRYMAHPLIQKGYRISSGGFGTVSAIVMEQPIEITHAVISMTKRKGWVL